MRNEVRQQTFPEIKRELMTRHLYADIDIVVKFRSQTYMPCSVVLYDVILYQGKTHLAVLFHCQNIDI